MNRNLDGIYHRVERNGKFENVCFSDLTEAEREEICKDRPALWYKRVAFHLADRLKDVGREFGIIGSE